MGAAFVRGVQAHGVIATLKHFAGHAASRSGRNHASASIGRRELEDVHLPPFEACVREGGARSVHGFFMGRAARRPARQALAAEKESGRRRIGS